jgi:hypothetical protein
MVRKKLVALSIDVEQSNDKLAAKELLSVINAVGRGTETKIMLDSDIQRITQSLLNKPGGKFG